MQRLSVAIALILVVAAHGPVAAQAVPRVDAERCAALMLEQIKFKELGVEADMQKGADWGKANLAPSRLNEIRDYIGLQEELKFGCREASLLVDPSKLVDPAAQDPAKLGDKAAETGDAADQPKKLKRKRPSGTAPLKKSQDLIWPGLTP